MRGEAAVARRCAGVAVHAQLPGCGSRSASLAEGIVPFLSRSPGVPDLCYGDSVWAHLSSVLAAGRSSGFVVCRPSPA
uniref:Uncharacterized protein n=1 Tax=Arundo donax TaxID=35708 RepID=A0A0A9FGS5_ARUDO